MQEFERVCGDSFKKLYHIITWDFSFDADGFWLQNGKIHSGNVGIYYNNVIKFDIDCFVEWVYDNAYQEKLGLEVE